eukprot:359743_1
MGWCKCCLHIIAISLVFIAVLLQYALNPTESDNTYCNELTDDEVKPYHNLFNLSDGRTLEYFHFGDINSNNYLLTIHGVMTEGSVSYRNNKFFKHLNLNVIAPSIPGWGMSSVSKQQSSKTRHLHSILNDANDVMELINYLKINKFMLGGWSAGALYAMAIASIYPNRITKLGLFVPLSMYYDKCEPFPTKMETNIRYFLGVKYVRHVMSMITSNLITNSYMENYIKPQNMNDMVWNSMKRSFCKSYNGLNVMSEYVVSNWSDINFNQISKINKVIISSNLNDTINIPAMQRCLNKLIKGSKLIEFHNKTHYDVMKQTETLLNIFVK